MSLSNGEQRQNDAELLCAWRRIQSAASSIIVGRTNALEVTVVTRTRMCRMSMWCHCHWVERRSANPTLVARPSRRVISSIVCCCILTSSLSSRRTRRLQSLYPCVCGRRRRLDVFWPTQALSLHAGADPGRFVRFRRTLSVQISSEKK